MTEYYVGVGGGINRLQAMVVAPEGERLKIVGQARQTGQPEKGNPDRHLDRLEAVIRFALKEASLPEADIKAIGVSSVGQVDYNTQMIIYSTNLDLRNYPLGEELGKRFGGVPAAVSNDVVSHMVGEHRFGVAKGVEHLVYFYVDYGTGSALLLNNQIYLGADGLAGEIGHAGINLHGRLCDCGNSGCLEAICSQRAVARAIRARWHQGWNFTFEDLIDLESDIDTVTHLITPHLIQDAILAGDKQVIRVIQEAAEGMAYSVAGVINFLNPQMVVLGGGMLNTVDLLYEQTREMAFEGALRPSAERVRIERSRLGGTAEIYGAVARAVELFGGAQPAG